MESVVILGCGSALPASNRNPSAQVLVSNGDNYLIDCGEGTQMKLRQNKLSFSRINHIFISHLHGDHFLGLPGLISTFNLLGREKELQIFGPAGLQEILDVQFKYSNTKLNFKLVFNVISVKGKEKLLETRDLLVYTFPLNHRIECYGYQFQEKKKLLKLRVDKLEEYRVPKMKRKGLTLGEDFVCPSGEVISNSVFTYPPKELKCYSYCSDNRVKLDVQLSFIKGTTTLYHETTFEHDLLARAKKTFHSTGVEAATLAKEANVKCLIAGHFSSRYNDLKGIEEECKSIFPNTLLAKEGEAIAVQ